MYYLSKIRHSRDIFVDSVEEFNANCNASRDGQLQFASEASWIGQVCKELADTVSNSLYPSLPLSINALYL